MLSLDDFVNEEILEFQVRMLSLIKQMKQEKKEDNNIALILDTLVITIIHFLQRPLPQRNIKL